MTMQFSCRNKILDLLIIELTALALVTEKSKVQVQRDQVPCQVLRFAMLSCARQTRFSPLETIPLQTTDGPTRRSVLYCA